MSFRSGGRGGANQIFQVFGFVNVNQVVYTFEVPIAINNTNIIVLARGSGCQLGGQKDNWGGWVFSPPNPPATRAKVQVSSKSGWGMEDAPFPHPKFLGGWIPPFPLDVDYHVHPIQSPALTFLSVLIAWCSAPSDICSRCR